LLATHMVSVAAVRRRNLMDCPMCITRPEMVEIRPNIFVCRVCDYTEVKRERRTTGTTAQGIPAASDAGTSSGFCAESWSFQAPSVRHRQWTL